ncbi:uncharacterized protein LOC135154872 [Lytechinus pictus]|uniref:uncharacterized protein LOC135154872 n=1 Tax=Lytechinus pictus TaxID=7653 RepID=UPI0030B9E6C0
MLVEDVYDLDDKLIPKGGSIVVAEGGNKTLVCKTNTSVKLPVDLEWEIPKGMIMLWYIVRPPKLLNDSNDNRLALPTLTIDFSPTYMDDDDGEIELVCIVKNSSQINASVIIKKEGAHEPKTVGNSPMTSLYYSHSNTESTAVGNSPVTRLLYSHSSTAKCGQSEDWKPVHTVIVVGCLSFVFLITSVCGIIGYRKRIGNADGVSMTTIHLKDSNQEPAHADFTMSNPGVCGDPAVSRSDVVPKQPIQDAHVYMEMKPISLPTIPSNHQTSPPGNFSSLNPTQPACDSSLQAWQGGSTLDIILNSCDGGYISCSGPTTFLPQQGIALESPDSVITTYL